MPGGIIDFKKQKFIRDCKDYLKTGKITDSLNVAINSTTPGHLEYLKKDLDTDTKKIIDSAIQKIKKIYRKEITTHRQKVNMLAISALENLSTLDKRFEITEVMDRYRESINPVKALYYDLQEIMFLYDGKAKKEHHKFLIDKFSKKENFEEILLSVNRDIEDLSDCKVRLKLLRDEYGVPGNSEYSKKVIDLHNEMLQWKKLFEKFPQWVSDNSDNEKPSLLKTLKDFFS